MSKKVQAWFESPTIYLEHVIERGQGHLIIPDNWIGGSCIILADIALENIIYA